MKAVDDSDIGIFKILLVKELLKKYIEAMEKQVCTCTNPDCEEEFEFTSELIVGEKGIFSGPPKREYQPKPRWLPLECPHCKEEDSYKVIA